MNYKTHIRIAALLAALLAGLGPLFAQHFFSFIEEPGERKKTLEDVAWRFDFNKRHQGNGVLLIWVPPRDTNHAIVYYTNFPPFIMPDSQPEKQVMYVNYEPVVTKTNGFWQIEFKPGSQPEKGE